MIQSRETKSRAEASNKLDLETEKEKDDVEKGQTYLDTFGSASLGRFLVA
jgi:hypothetical protein